MSRGYQYSRNSLAKIKTTEQCVVDLCFLALSIANNRKAFCPDFGISHGLRTAEEQFELYKLGRHKDVYDNWHVIDEDKVVTNCDGYIKLSIHQSKLAIDFYCYVDGKANYDLGNIALVAMCFMEAAADLGLKVNSGLNFKSISDGGHLEVEL